MPELFPAGSPISEFVEPIARGESRLLSSGRYIIERESDLPVSLGEETTTLFAIPARNGIAIPDAPAITMTLNIQTGSNLVEANILPQRGFGSFTEQVGQSVGMQIPETAPTTRSLPQLTQDLQEVERRLSRSVIDDESLEAERNAILESIEELFANAESARQLTGRTVNIEGVPRASGRIFTIPEMREIASEVVRIFPHAQEISGFRETIGHVARDQTVDLGRFTKGVGFEPRPNTFPVDNGMQRPPGFFTGTATGNPQGAPSPFGTFGADPARFKIDPDDVTPPFPTTEAQKIIDLDPDDSARIFREGEEELGRAYALLDEGRDVKRDVDFSDSLLKWQERLHDAFFGVRQIQAGVAKIRTLKPEDNIIELLNTAPGRANAGFKRAKNAGAEIKSILDGINPIIINGTRRKASETVELFLKNQQNLSILAQKGGRELLNHPDMRKVSGGFSPEDLARQLNNSHLYVGNQVWRQIEDAADVVRKVYQQELDRGVRFGFIRKELADDLKVRYPWYNPTHLIEYAEKQVAAGGRPPSATRMNNGLYRLGETGSDSASRAPFEVMTGTLISNEVRFANNEIRKTIVRMGEELGIPGFRNVTRTRPRGSTAPTQGEAAAGVLSEGGTSIQASAARPTSIAESAAGVPINKKRKLVVDTFAGKTATSRGNTGNTLDFWDEGVHKTYEVPDFVFRELVTIREMSPNAVSNFFGFLNGIMRTALITQNPWWIVGNAFVDTLTAGVTRGIIPPQTAATLMRGLKGDDLAREIFELTGGLQQRFYGQTEKQLTDKVIKSGGRILKDDEITPARIGRTLWDAVSKPIPAFGQAVEQAPRVSLFRRELDKALPNWKNMNPEDVAASPEAIKAASEAIELTVNFARGGYVIKQANQYLLFLNATMEGTKLPFRAMGFGELVPGNLSLRALPGDVAPTGVRANLPSMKQKNEAKMRMAIIAAAGSGLTAYNMTYPEYFDIPAEIRYGSVVIMLPPYEKNVDGTWKPNYWTLPPKTREFGLFMAPFTYTMERMFAQHPTDFGTFAKTMFGTTAPVTDMPLPPVIEEIMGQSANYDFFRNDPIVPPELQSRPPEDQVLPWTSRTAQEIGSKVGLSPVRIDHATSGLFGGLGREALTLSDWIIEKISPTELDVKIQSLADEYEEIEGSTPRRTFLNNLSPEDRESVVEIIQKPDSKIPLLSQFKQRFAPGRGGDVQETGERLADERTNVDSDETKRVSKELSTASRLQFNEQQEDDVAFESGELNGSEWRRNRNNRGREFAGKAETLEINFPDAVQFADPEVRKEYYDIINTAVKQVGDHRTRGQILANGWYAIRPEEVSQGRDDMGTYFQQRQEYERLLSEEDRALLTYELESRMTPLEREYHSDLRELLSDYFSTTRNEMANAGLEDVFDRYQLLPSIEQGIFRDRNKTFAKIIDRGSKLRLEKRDQNAPLERSLIRWDFGIETPVNRAVQSEQFVGAQ